MIQSDENIFEENSIRYEAQNLIKIYSNLKSETLDTVLNDFNGKTFSDFKKDLSELLVEKIYPISKKIKQYRSDDKELINILNMGLKKQMIQQKKLF